MYNAEEYKWYWNTMEIPQQALWVVEPERRHDMEDLHYGNYYHGDDWDGGWGEMFVLSITTLVSLLLSF